LVVADFKREYQIDLFRNAETMDCDEFFMLLYGLSADSRFMYYMAKKNKENKPARNNDGWISVKDPKQIRAILGG
jgi:hypothetical protein